MDTSLFGPTKQSLPLSFLASKASSECPPPCPGSPEIPADTNLEMGGGLGGEDEPQKPLDELDCEKDSSEVLECDNLTCSMYHIYSTKTKVRCLAGCPYGSICWSHG